MKQYLTLLETIKEKGTYKPAAREGMPGTQSLFGHQFRHNLADGFPLLTTKKMFWKGVVVELLFFLRGDTNIKYLIDNNVNIWNEDAYQYYIKQCNKQGISLPMRYDSFIDDIKRGQLDHTDLTGGYKLGDCGYQYGKVWRNWDNDVYVIDNGDNGERIFTYIDQIRNVINSLQQSPESRRHIITAVDPAHDKDLALYWCHSLFQFNCRPTSKYDAIRYASQYEDSLKANPPKYYLDCQLYQRSGDSFLGVPMNTASYALLIHLLCNECNMIPGEFIHSFGDVHIYDNHIEQVNEQLNRTPGKLPTLNLAEHINITSIINGEVEYQEIMDSLYNYNPQSAIKGKLSTGLK